MFSTGLPQPLKDSVPIRAFCVFRFFMLFMIKVLWTIMRINTKGINTFVKQTKMLAKRGLDWNSLFIPDNLIECHRPGDILIKVLSWFCLERDQGRPSACVTEIREQSGIASIRKTDMIFKVSAGAAFLKSLESWSALLVRSSHDLVMFGISCAGSWHLPLFYFLRQPDGSQSRVSECSVREFWQYKEGL